jgi:hypothetical protein
VVHDARDIVGELAILGTVEVGLYLGAGGHRQFSLEVEGIERIPQLGTNLGTQLGSVGRSD